MEQTGTGVSGCEQRLKMEMDHTGLNKIKTKPKSALKSQSEPGRGPKRLFNFYLKSVRTWTLSNFG